MTNARSSSRWARALGVGMAWTLVPAMALAQAGWPARPLRMVHGFTAGGNVDFTARLVGAGMADQLGQQVVIDMRPGAGGTIAASIVARADPDGYTLFTMASGHSTSPGLYRSLPYDPVADFTMVSLVASFPFVIAVGPGTQAATVEELVRAARAQPGKIPYATAGVGTGMHLASVLFQSRTGTTFNHVPYKGGTATPLALAQGEVPMMFGTPAEVQPHLSSGRVRVLAVTTPSRWDRLPDVPALAEAVAPGFDVRGWMAIAGPRGMPERLVARIEAVVHAVLKRGDVQEKLAQIGSPVSPTRAADTQRFLAAEVARWKQVMREAGIQPQQ